MKESIFFYINDSENIELEREISSKKFYLFEEVRVILNSNNKKYILYEKDFMCEAIRRFRNLLEEVVAGKLELHSSLKKGKLGFYWNEYCADRSGLVMIQGEQGKYWVGLRHLLWCSNRGFATWLYNENGEIVLEVTLAPTYKWHFTEPLKGDKSYIRYSKFRKNYKTTYVKKIPLNIAQTWLAQSNNIINDMTECYPEDEEYDD